MRRGGMKTVALPKRTATNTEVGQAIHVLLVLSKLTSDGTVSRSTQKSGKIKVVFHILV